MTREEAAAKAVNSDFSLQWEKLPDWVKHDYVREMTTALAASDAHDAANGVHRVRQDDATVERAARALMAQWECEAYVVWLGASDAICELHETDWVAEKQCCATALDTARLALAAAVKEDG